MVSRLMPPPQATGTTNSQHRLGTPKGKKNIKAAVVDDHWSAKSFWFSSDTLLVSVRPWYSKDIYRGLRPIYPGRTTVNHRVPRPVSRALDPLWIPCVTYLSERIFVQANNLLWHGKTILSIVYLAVFSSGFLRQANARIAIVAIDLSTQSKIFEPPPSNSWRFWQT